jgi:hypothetical protein
MPIRFSNFIDHADKKTRVISPDPERLIIGYSYLSNLSLPLSDDYLYIGAISELPNPHHAGNSNFILYEDQKISTDYLRDSDANMLIAPTKRAFNELNASIHDRFDVQRKINDFGFGLLELIRNGEKVHELMNYAYKTLGNPVFIWDAALSLVAHAGAESVERNDAIDYLLAKGVMSDELVAEVLSNDSEGADLSNPELRVWQSELLNNRFYLVQIIRSSKLIGYLGVIESNKPILIDQDTDQITLLGLFCAIALDSPSQVSLRYPIIESFMTDILDARYQQSQTIEKREETFCLNLKKYKTVINIRFKDAFVNLDRFAVLKQRIQRLLNRNTIIVYENSIVALFDKDRLDRIMAPEKLVALQELLESFDCTAAISLAFENLYQFKEYYQQTNACFDIVSKTGVENRLLCYEDFKLTHMLLSFGSHIDLRTMIDPVVSRVLAIDEQRGSEMADMLFTYVNHRQDMTSAAKTMNVHYNTMKHRIGRIREVVDIDFNDADLMFKIMLSQKILEVLRMTGKY